MCASASSLPISVLLTASAVYLPVYFQACMGASPIHSSVNMLATTLICAPVSLFAGGIVKKRARYRPVNYVGWILMLIGFGLFTLFKADSSTGMWAGFQIITAAGIGIIVSGFNSCASISADQWVCVCTAVVCHRVPYPCFYPRHPLRGRARVPELPANVCTGTSVRPSLSPSPMPLRDES